MAWQSEHHLSTWVGVCPLSTVGDCQGMARLDLGETALYGEIDGRTFARRKYGRTKAWHGNESMTSQDGYRLSTCVGNSQSTVRGDRAKRACMAKRMGALCRKKLSTTKARHNKTNALPLLACAFVDYPLWATVKTGRGWIRAKWAFIAE